MPVLDLVTNVKIDDLKSFVTEFSKVGAETLAKPEGYICTNVKYNEVLSWNGTFDPAFVLSITSLDNINPAANVQYSKALFEFLNKKLGVPGDRGYIAFLDPGRENLGYQGTTFGELWK
ncbi:Tautomerase/MIF [Pluteus cervinus]|uniref:Tautomerase/MIF n=1 Tax=Pluteus cervinus TaxID=181527 RepID=A0ACD3B5I4_9AGAR|nr:Tautomerase/MIF [Pluteus cervinus]